MSFFSTILQKLGLASAQPAAPAAPAAASPAATPVAAPAKPAAAPVKPVAPAVAAPKSDAEKAKDSAAMFAAAAASAANAAKAAAPKPISEVDVVAQLEKMASGSDYNWKVSIVDLLKVLGIDSSREARNELATELGCPADLMQDSAKMNVWLHKEVLKKIAENGGNIPQDMLN
jgi:hypothetical protein